MSAATAIPPKPTANVAQPQAQETIDLQQQQQAAAAAAAMEALALQNGMLPVTLVRESCSPEAEKLLRKLGRVPHSGDPWLPIAVIGPLLVMAHHNPKAGDFWGVPLSFTVRIVISAEQYQNTRADLVNRFTHTPIASENPCERLVIPRFSELGMADTFQWLIKNYPYDTSDAERLQKFYKAAQEKKDVLEISDFNTMARNLGPALRYLTANGKIFIYNGSEAPRQSFFPSHLLERHGVYPLFVGKSTIYLLSEHQDCYAFEDEWHSLGNTPVRIVPVLCDPVGVREAIARANASFDPSSIAEVNSDNLTEKDDVGIVELVPEDMARINPATPNHTQEELMHWALFTAIRCRASDLHIEKFYNLTRFRARIDGSMKVILTAPEDQLSRFVALIKNYANMSQTRQECQDGRFSMRIGRRRLDARVAAVPTRREFQKIIMRFLDKQDGVKRLSDFNLTQRQLDILTRTMQRDQGLVLVTGPTGSGKTTTLYALLNSVNDADVNIQTIEDPIEYEIEGINQTQTNPTYGLTFANGLRSLLRADPDIILIGESRDSETANSAINASLTGHLVLTTLHANDSIRAVSRLLSMGVEKYLVADSLALSQAQRLVRRLCNYCKRPIPASEDVQGIMVRQNVITQPLTQPIYEKVGCKECHGTGYSGRVALMELCEITDEIRDFIEGGAPQSSLRASALKNGFRTLYQEGLGQVIAGTTTMEEIRCLSYTAI
jgi:type II secretory ATPase GspE/PulE/Tfp pilus assembly ATPase PilB-like protein